MAYRIRKSDDDVQVAFRRIADEQIAKALDEIASDTLSLAEKVHQVRKRCKKIRGLLRLVRPAFGDYGDENKAFRDAARLLSDIRDADSLIETYDALMDHFADQIDRRAFASIRARLTKDARDVHRQADTAIRLETFRRTLDEARDRVSDWTLDDTGFDALGGGVAKTYKRARKRMEDAWADPGTGTMHQWRKRVKYHWYHARLLGKTNPPMMEPHRQAADELSDVLGDHHDLAILAARLDDAPSDFGSKTDLDAFRALLGQRSEDLAARAFDLGRLILSERKSSLGNRWENYWDGWQSGDREPDRLVAG